MGGEERRGEGGLECEESRRRAEQCRGAKPSRAEHGTSKAKQEVPGGLGDRAWCGFHRALVGWPRQEKKKVPEVPGALLHNVDLDSSRCIIVELGRT